MFASNTKLSNNLAVRVAFNEPGQPDSVYYLVAQWIVAVLNWRVITYPTRWAVTWHNILSETDFGGNTNPCEVEILVRIMDPQLPGYGSACYWEPFHADETLDPRSLSIGLREVYEAIRSKFELIPEGHAIKPIADAIKDLPALHALGVSGLPSDVMFSRWKQAIEFREEIIFRPK